MAENMVAEEKQTLVSKRFSKSMVALDYSG